MSKYNIIDDFQANTGRILVLDHDLEVMPHDDGAYINGIKYEYRLNSILKWLILLNIPVTKESFKGKTVVFK